MNGPAGSSHATWFGLYLVVGVLSLVLSYNSTPAWFYGTIGGACLFFAGGRLWRWLLELEP